LNLLYHLGLWLYRLIARLMSPFYTKAALFTEGHNGLISKIKQQISHDNPIVWFHCASLGEFEQGRPIIEGYKVREPDHKILLTFFSPSGYEVRKGSPLADWVFYMPLDTRRNARRFLDIVQPSKAIFVKYEFWYNFLITLKKRRIPTYVVSATFRPSQPFFRWYGAFFRRMLRNITLLFVQNQSSKELLLQIGFMNTVVAGDTRFDRVWAQSQLPCHLPVVEAFCDQTKKQEICVVGSSWPQDEALLLQALRERPALSLIIAPHEIDSSHIDQIMERFASFHPTRYSHTPIAGGLSSDSRVLVIDTIGLLSSLYRYGSIAYVGGGFGDGIHNILEAAVYGIPVLFGPRYQKFNEATDLVSLGGARSIQTDRELIAQMREWIDTPQNCIEAGQICGHYVKEHVGATGTVLEHISLNL